MANWNLNPDFSLPHLMQGGRAEDGHAGAVPDTCRGEENGCDWLSPADLDIFLTSNWDNAFQDAHGNVNPVYSTGPNSLPRDFLGMTPGYTSMPPMSNSYALPADYQAMSYPSGHIPVSVLTFNPTSGPTFNPIPNAALGPASIPISNPPAPTRRRRNISSQAIQPRVPCTHPNCNKSYARPSDLRRHERTHQASAQRIDCPHLGCHRRGANGFLRDDKCREHYKNIHEL